MMDNADLNSLKRVDETHPLDLYIGIDNLSRQTLFLISDTEPGVMTSSQIMSVSMGERKDSRWGISFTLLDNKYNDIFNCFCNDIIESSRSIKDIRLGSVFIANRYNNWQQMLSKSRGELLSINSIKGLIGEILFLKEYLIPLYGQDLAVNSWIGPDRADQDFVCENIWYEVKATDSGSESVSIASIEQLDIPTDGELAIVYLDKTSETDGTKITLNRIYQEVRDSLISEDSKNRLSEILLNFGYYIRKEYDEPAYKLSKINRYKVDKDFPSMRRQNIPNAIVNSKYQLSVSYIGKWLIEK
jgi:hypothetical protein